jgi:diguanylate cyclase (GGDEF)-like protein
VLVGLCHGAAPDGVLMAVAPASASGSLAAALPAVRRSLERELTARRRLREARGHLQVQAAEERLLHEVESLLHADEPLEAAVQRILDRAIEHLRVRGASFCQRSRRRSWVAGAGVTAAAAERAAAARWQRVAAGEFAPDAVVLEDDDSWIALRDIHAEPSGILTLHGRPMNGVSERRLARILRYVASHLAGLEAREYDPLTGLLAWRAFERKLAGEVAAGAERLVVIFDVDQMHVVNETFGRATCDDVLRRLGSVIDRELPAGSIAARSGADDFVVLLGSADVGRARSFATRVGELLRDVAYEQGERTWRPLLSVGIGPCSDSEESGNYLTSAQTACRAAKERGGGRVEVFENADVSIVRRLDDLQIVGYVRQAIESDRLALVAQQLQPLRSGRVPHYFEVLVRLVADHGELIAPADFMSAAERYRLMEELDRWVVETTLRTLAAHGGKLRDTDARFAINLSGQSLGSSAFQEFLEAAVSRSGVNPGLLTFEITETVAVTSIQQAQAFMQSVRRMGCHLSLDDFGTGLASFSYLKLFPVDTLKIDGSFIRDIASNLVSQSVVAAIGEVARVMRLETIAEFVQDQASLDLLRGLNISYAQGYFVGTTERLEEQIRRCIAADRGAVAQARS